MNKPKILIDANFVLQLTDYRYVVPKESLVAIGFKESYAESLNSKIKRRAVRQYEVVEVEGIGNRPFFVLKKDSELRRKVEDYLDTTIENFVQNYCIKGHSHYTVPRSREIEFETFLDEYNIGISLEARIRIFESTKILNSFNYLREGRKWSYFFENASDFYSAVFSLVKSEQLHQRTSDECPRLLPTSRAKLIEKAERYKRDGIGPTLMAKKGIKNHQKIGKLSDGSGYKEEAANALLAEISTAYGNINSKYWIARKFNEVAPRYGFYPVSERTIINHFLKPEVQHKIKIKREGLRAYDNSFKTVIHRSRSTEPLKRVEYDAFVLELNYQFNGKTKNGGNIKKYHGRIKVAMIYDSFLEYPIGFAFGDTENTELIKLAVRNAQTHLKDLSGNYYRFGTFAHDHFGGKELRSLFDQISKHHIPTEARNARAKKVESWIGRFQNTLQDQLNYSGGNIESKRKVNTDYKGLAFIKNNYPTKEELLSQAYGKLEEWRNEVVDEGSGETRQQQYRRLLIESESCQDKILSRQTYLRLFGEVRRRTQRFTSNGFHFKVNGAVKWFHILDSKKFNKCINRHFHIQYDPYDLSDILAIDEESREFLVSECPEIPDAIEDMTDEDFKNLDQLRSFQKANKQLAKEQMRAAELIVQENFPELHRELYQIEGERKGRYVGKGDYKQIDHDTEDQIKALKGLDKSSIKEVDQHPIPQSNGFDEVRDDHPYDLNIDQSEVDKHKPIDE